MARLVVKIKYMKPNANRKMGKYAKYIGTREGVAKIDDSHRENHPDEQGNVPGLDESIRPTTYADYIATRPRAERNGKHGLFTNEGEEVNLEEVSRELNAFQGTIWTAIISIKRADAELLGFDTGARWRDIIRANRDELARQFKIKPSNLRWYGAFHNESYHPHVHLIIYDRSNRGYLSQEGVENIKSMFAHAIFQDEMLMLEREKTDKRDMLRLRGKDEIEEIISRIQNGTNDNMILQAMLLDLARRIREHRGKKAYAYLKKEDKRLVDSIVDEIALLPSVKELYDMWYEKQEALARIYKSEMPVQVPLSKNQVFRSIKNSVVDAARELDNTTEDANMPVKTDTHTSNRDQTIQHTYYARQVKPERIALTVTRLMNNIGHIFREQFQDNPKHSVKVERKVWVKIREKEEAHGMKQG